MEEEQQIVSIDDVGNRLKSNKMTDLMAKRDKIFHKLKRKWKNSCDSCQNRIEMIEVQKNFQTLILDRMF